MSGGILGGPPVQGSGILGGFNQFANDNSAMLLGLGAGLLSGQGYGAGMAGAMQGMQADERTRQIRMKEAEEVRRKQAGIELANKLGRPELAEFPEIATALYVKQNTPKELSFEERQFNALTPEQQAQYRQQKFLNGGADGYGLNPIYGTDAQGNPVIMQMGKGGRAVQTALPEGVKLSKEPIKLDAGTHFVLIDPISRQPVGTIPKDIAGEASLRKQGEARGTEIAGAQQALDTADQTIKEIDELRNHPGRKIATGGSSILPSLPGTEKRNFDTRVAQLKGKTFLQAYQGMKGTGAISEAEGKKAEDAIARLDTAQSEGEFVQALNDLEAVVKLGAQRLRSRSGASPTQAPQTPQRRRYNPQTGEFE